MSDGSTNRSTWPRAPGESRGGPWGDASRAHGTRRGLGATPAWRRDSDPRRARSALCDRAGGRRGSVDTQCGTGRGQPRRSPSVPVPDLPGDGGGTFVPDRRTCPVSESGTGPPSPSESPICRRRGRGLGRSPAGPPGPGPGPRPRFPSGGPARPASVALPTSRSLSCASMRRVDSDPPGPDRPGCHECAMAECKSASTLLKQGASGETVRSELGNLSFRHHDDIDHWHRVMIMMATVGARASRPRLGRWAPLRLWPSAGIGAAAAPPLAPPENLRSLRPSLSLREGTSS